MRLDLLLKYLCLVKSRSLARKGCDGGFIRLNGRAVPAHKEVKTQDVIEITYPDRVLVVSIKEIPDRQVPKRDRFKFFEVLRENKRSTGFD